MASVGPYQLQGLIGRGGMGEVYRAFDTRRQRTVALKLLPAALAQNLTYRERFRRESLAAAGLSSPHVVPIHDFGEVAGRLFIDMRLIQGTDLASHLTRGPFTPARAAEVVRQAGDALTDAHQHGVLHRDVKPSNILLTDTDFVYLVDFGIAHVAGDASLTETGTTVGTFGYMAPERLDGTVTDARADVYSLTCVLYELLVGQRPYAHHTSTPSLIQAHMHEPPPTVSRRNPVVPPAFDRVVARGMAKDPAARYPSIAALLIDVQHIVDPKSDRAPSETEHVISFAAEPASGDTPRATSPAMASVVAMKPGRRALRWPLAALGAVLLVGLGASAAVWLRPAAEQQAMSSPRAAATGTPTSSATAAPPSIAPTTDTSASTATSAVQRYTLRLTGTARAASINFNIDGSSGSASEAPLPWTRDVDANSGTSSHLALLSAFSPPGDPGTLTCTILDETGRVVNTNTASSLGGQFGSASVNCSGG